MALVNCQQCELLFHSYGAGRRCPICIEAEEEALRSVIEFLREPGRHSVQDIAEATGVDRHLIVRWLRHQRLHVELPPGELECRRCRAPVEGGSFCEVCRLKLAEEVAEQRRLVEGLPAPTQPVRNSGAERMYSRSAESEDKTS